MKTKKHPKANLEKKRGLYFMIGLVISLGFVFTAFEWKTYVSNPVELEHLYSDHVEEEMIPITQRQKVPPPPPPPIQTEAPPKIVENKTKVVNEPKTEVPIAHSTIEVFKQPPEVIVEPDVFVVVEDMPVFPGCEDVASKNEREICTNNKIYKYIIEHTKYPPMAKDAGISGTVYIRYVLDENGKVSDVTIQHGVEGGELLNEEAIRVINSLPQMTPGKQRGQNVRVEYNARVKFNLK